MKETPKENLERCKATLKRGPHRSIHPNFSCTFRAAVGLSICGIDFQNIAIARTLYLLFACVTYNVLRTYIYIFVDIASIALRFDKLIKHEPHLLDCLIKASERLSDCL